MLQAQDGADLLVNIAAGPSRAPGSAAGMAAIAGWHKMQDTYALLGTVAIAFCNRVGNEEGLTFWGGSRILAADGSTVVEAPLWEEALVVGAMDTDDVRMQRYGLPLLADERLELMRRELDRIIAERADLPAPPDERMSEPDGPPPLPAIEPAQAVEVIIGFIRAQMEQTGFERIVLGLSGGVDSATVAFLCARAVGARQPARGPHAVSDLLRGLRDRCAARRRPRSAAGPSGSRSRRWSIRCSRSIDQPDEPAAATCSTCGAAT